ncbi:hypothetical protein KQI58_14775 [Enterococcus raffinosus]|uniref:DUF6440 family protein n=1 Tax=Enterococcus raffinosus TaxID=71452 RepID=UPI001C0F658E|nr:DUF6440 family protein [Enterococcus raffinosus]MBU5362338.1 hypothetical protein [Enterococcus raffinosus]
MSKVKRFYVKTIETSGPGITTVVTDKQSGVQYLLAIVPNMGSGMAVLVDKEGKPMLAEMDK